LKITNTWYVKLRAVPAADRYRRCVGASIAHNLPSTTLCERQAEFVRLLPGRQAYYAHN
jgi:hypothetical protein